jgi:hypothetical protein
MRYMALKDLRTGTMPWRSGGSGEGAVEFSIGLETAAASWDTLAPSRRRSRVTPLAGDLMRMARRTILTACLALSLAAVGVALGPACAQEMAPSEPLPTTLSTVPPQNTIAPGLQVTVTPYLWLSKINAAIDTPLRRSSVVDANVSGPQLLGNLDAIAITTAVEVRDGPFGILGDVLHVPVSATITTHNAFVQGGSAALNVNSGTALLLYRAVAAADQSLDVGLGFRAWDFYSSLTLNVGNARAAMAEPSTDWGDPLIGARYHRDFGDGLGITVYGDAGGLGVAAHSDWQVIGTVDYRLKTWATLHIGYRSLNVDYSAEGGGLGFNVHMRGPIFAASFRF